MKKIARLAALTTAGFLLFGFTANPVDTNFEGIVTYSVKIDSDNPQAAQFLQGATFKIYIKGSKVRTEFSTAMIKQISIEDAKNPDGVVILKEFMGNKYQIKMDDKAKKTADASQPDIKYLSGSKTIAGYDCKEAQITETDKSSGKKYTNDVYYTDQLPYTNGKYGDFNGLKGFPLAFVKVTNGNTTNMTAQSVQKGSVDDSEFEVPAGYKLVTEQEMMQDMMSQRGGGGN
jgi:GLPGLI family protein